uniref:Uncharacterized protein n=1 Tax=Mus musculus TaxID=10090 RepID=Q3UU32_MOUSE|nr:unnamed protein product [Mus musculus]
MYYTQYPFARLIVLSLIYVAVLLFFFKHTLGFQNLLFQEFLSFSVSSIPFCREFYYTAMKNLHTLPASVEILPSIFCT